MSSAETDAQIAEMRARRALGLTTEAPRAQQQQQRSQQGRQRHRFVQDGEVPVTILNGTGKSAPATNRIADLEAALETERAARAAVVRSLDEARILIQSLQTRLAHTELVSAETVAAERRARAEAEAALQEALAECKPAPAIETRAVEPIERPADLPVRKQRAKKTAKTVSSKPAAKPMARDAAPVKWWLPGFNAKKHVG